MYKTLTLALLLFSQALFAKSTTERIGDILALGIPLSAGINSFYIDDKEGEKELLTSYGATMATTMLLKYTVREKRPDTNEHDSFPSGHTASAFAGASYMHQRYGWKYAIVPYLAATYTGYSRIHANRHHTQDVLAGATLAVLSSWYFTTPYKNCTLQVRNASDKNSLVLSYRW